MEFRIIKMDDVMHFDTSVAEKKAKDYSEDYRVFERGLKRVERERKHALQILEIVNGLSAFARDGTRGEHDEEYFFFTEDGRRAIVTELNREWLPSNLDYQIIPLHLVKKVKCPGCSETRALIGCLFPTFGICAEIYEEVVICGNTVHTLKRLVQGKEVEVTVIPA